MEWGRLVPELTVSDFAESIRFYTDILGFEVMFSRSDSADFAYLEFGGSQLMLEEFHADGWNVARLEKPYGRGINLQIECSSADELRDRLSNSEYPLYQEIEDVWRVKRVTWSPARVSSWFKTRTVICCASVSIWENATEQARQLYASKH